VVGERSGSGGRAPGARVFISYRRELDAGWAPWLYDRLAERFGSESVFMDLDSIVAGDDFAEVIKRSVASCQVFIALIGKGWSSATSADGARRLDDPGDFVRIEIESALHHGVRVVPLLIEGATMPRASELPDSLAPLVSRQALPLSGQHRQYDVNTLIQAVKRVIDETRLDLTPPPLPEPPPPHGRVLASLEPDLARGFRRAKTSVRLQSEAHERRTVMVHAVALSDSVTVAPTQVDVPVAAGATAVHRLDVRAATPHWWGRARTSGVRVHTDDRHGSPQTLEGRFRQRAVFGWPALAALILMAGLVIALAFQVTGAYVVVPSVAADEASARRSVQQVGLVVDAAAAPSETVANGKVIRTEPAAGTRVRRGSHVTLYLSSGLPNSSPTPTPTASVSPTLPKPCAAVPALTGRSEQDAKAALAAAGIYYHITRRSHPTVGAGQVLSTEPGPGSQACKGVELYVSSGPPVGCSLSPSTGPGGSTVSVSCRGFAPGETVTVRWGSNPLASMTATGTGTASTSVTIPSGFAGSNTPGRVFTLRADGQTSGRHASANFTVQGPSQPPTDPDPSAAP